LQKLKAIDNIKAQNILKLKTNKQEKKKEQVDSYITFAFNDKFFNLDFALFKIFSRIIKELL
jgi:hypothetical protein